MPDGRALALAESFSMTLTEKLRVLAQRLPDIRERLGTEEATKNALILPFIKAMGYDPFNPAEVVPEFTADIGIKRGEKVDYAILRDGVPIILIECKRVGADLNRHDSQLCRYFHTVAARIAILTDGICYRVYSDLDAQNKMDQEPFLELNLEDFNENMAIELEKLTKSSFDIDTILASASDLKYSRKMTDLLSRELENPSDFLVRAFADQIYDGRLTKNVLDRFRSVLRRAIADHITHIINLRLKSALVKNEEAGDAAQADIVASEEASGAGPSVETTMEELEGFYIVKALVRDLVPSDRVFARDAKTYFTVILDDNNRRPICRLWFNGPKKYLGIFDSQKSETKIPVTCVEDIFKHADSLRESLRHVM